MALDMILVPFDGSDLAEAAPVSSRWRLRTRAHRLSRTHGDFHPRNLLFREGTDFSGLDRSRGAPCPELTLHTDVQGLQGALDELLRLALRLNRPVPSRPAVR